MSLTGWVDLDPCSNPWSVVNAQVSYSFDRGENGLELPWLDSEGLVWVNPPYGRGMVRQWVEACIDEHWSNPRQDILLIVKCDPGVKWFQYAREHCCAWANPYKRIAFDRGTDDGNSADFSSTIFYWGERLVPFLRMMDGVAQVNLADQAFNREDLRAME